MDKFRFTPMLLFFIPCIWACSESGKAGLPISPQDLEAIERLEQSEAVLDGHQLANAYCNTCHLKPSPGSLDKKTWEKMVLPDMRRRLGLFFPKEEETSIENKSTSIHRDEPLVSEVNWSKIVYYYLKEAPETLSSPASPKPILRGIPGFELQIPDFGISRPSLTTLIFFDTISNHLYLGERNDMLFKIDPNSNLVLDSMETKSTPSDIRVQKNQIDLLEMGVMDPSDSAIGTWNSYQIGTGKGALPRLKNLSRPVNFEFGDLNGNGREDLVIGNFGNQFGSLTWYENTGKGYLAHLLKKEPGARRVKLRDMTGNGLLDIVVLMAQAKEGVFIFYNEGNGAFTEKPVLRFSPVFGSSDLDLVDFNGDGYLDILLTNGDNADLSPIFKPYHGVRIFLNDGQNQFEEKWFFPMHGASKAIAADFDGDGWMDIAAISFFPDFNQSPRQDFIYFKGRDELEFDPFVLETPLKSRWLVLEKGDVDRDGDKDILLGSFMLGQLRSPALTSGYFDEPWAPYVILKNQSLK